MKQIFSLVLLALSALLACCTQDELPGGSVIPPGYSLYVSSTVIGSGSHSETEVSTRAGSVLVPVTNGSLGIFRSKGAGYSGELNNIEYTYTGAAKGWQPTASTDTILLNGGDADVCAYYPYDGAMNFIDKTRIPIYSGKYTGNYSAVAGSSVYDLCYDINRTLNGSKRATTFEMKHAMAMLEFKITKDAGYQGDCRVTSVSILNPNLITESSIDISSGTYATTSSKGTVAYNPGDDADGILIGSIAATTSALLVPFTPDADGLTLSFAVNDMPVTANIGTDKLPKVEAGNRYTVKLTMKATSMEVTGVDMLPWEEIGVGGDDFTWYPTEDAVKLTDPIHIGSYDWAWSNLDYVDGNIALRDNQTWPDNFGHDGAPYLVHWPYCVLTPNLTDEIENGNTAYSYATDPCSALNALVPGTTWTLPTRHQMELLMATDHINEAGGCWFGTPTAIAPNKDDGTYLFLPANTQFFQVTGPEFNTGAYWMSDAGYTTLFFVGTNKSGYPGIIDRGTTNAPYNAMVRCVQKARETITIDGVEWAMGNLVKKSDGTYVIDDYQAALPPLFGSGGLWTDVTSGYHFVWNSLDRNSIGGDYAAYDYDPDNDPCAKASPAGTWRTPTKEEFEKAMAKGQVKGDYTLNGKTVTGFYLGTNTAPPAKGGGDEYLFLPIAGGGDQGSFYDFYAQYLTGTEKEGSEGGNEAYSFNASKLGDTGTMEIHYKSFPMAVRCVKGTLPLVHIIDIGLDFYIADGNLTATKNADGSLSYAFAKEQGYYSGKAAGGDLFCWNTADPFAFEVTQSSWEDARDPCRKVGDGNWRTPTDAELQKMIDAGNVWGENIYTMKDGTTKNGRYFGTTTVPAKADQDNYVFLPTAGYRNGSNINYAGSDGYYGSATLDSSDTNYAYYLNFYTYNCYVATRFLTNGYAFRCVHDK